MKNNKPKRPNPKQETIPNAGSVILRIDAKQHHDGIAVSHKMAPFADIREIWSAFLAGCGATLKELHNATGRPFNEMRDSLVSFLNDLEPDHLAFGPLVVKDDGSHLIDAKDATLIPKFEKGEGEMSDRAQFTAKELFRIKKQLETGEIGYDAAMQAIDLLGNQIQNDPEGGISNVED